MKIRKKLPLEVFRDPLGRGRWLACARDSVARRRHRRVAGYRPMLSFSDSSAIFQQTSEYSVFVL